MQDEINTEGLAILLQYFEDYRRALGGTSAFVCLCLDLLVHMSTLIYVGAQVSLEIPALAEMIGRLQASYQTQKSKNVDFFTKAEQVVPFFLLQVLYDSQNS